MNIRILFSFSLLLIVATGCQEEKQTADPAGNSAGSNKVSKVSNQVVEASCGECQFGMPGEGCDLAVKIDGKSYYVDGSTIDDHGDAHDENGMCNCVRKARVSGEIKDDRFLATSFELMPVDKEQLSRERLDKLKKSRLGASFAMKGGKELVVHDIWTEGLAAKAGLKKGDPISAINEKPVADLDPESLKSILGDESDLVFEVNRDGKPVKVKIEAPKN